MSTDTDADLQKSGGITLFDVCEPREDVLTGHLEESQFAAGLAEVAHESDAPDVYSNTKHFFDKTYPTTGLQTILTSLGKRLTAAHNGDDYSGESGVYRLDTSFGGGKTHNEIAAYHFANNPSEIENLTDFITDPDTKTAFETAVNGGFECNTAVFVGDYISTESHSHSNEYNGNGESPETKTMWGELIYQLFGEDVYAEYETHDTEIRPPGKAELNTLFKQSNVPSVILIDEIAHYFENASGVEVGDTTLANLTNTFLMSLLNATQNTDNVTVLISVADSAFESEAERVKRTINDFGSISEKFSNSIVPVKDTELPKVLKHRLFSEYDNDAAETIVDEYTTYYSQYKADFPGTAHDPDETDRLTTSYPFHPTTIKTLTEELDTLPDFQKTRGALRLLSRAVYKLWNEEQNDTNHDRHFIRLYDLHPSDEEVQSKLNDISSTVEIDFEPIIKADVYASDHGSHAQGEDDRWVSKRHPPLGTQITTTLLWKSIVRRAGEETPRQLINYAVAHPDVELSHYADALNNLVGEGSDKRTQCYYLYHEHDGYRFKSTVKVAKHIERVQQTQITDEDADLKIEKFIKQQINAKTDFNVVEFPDPETEIHIVPDEADTVNLCIMDFRNTTTDATLNDAPESVTKIYNNSQSGKGGTLNKRIYKNNTVFLIPERGTIKTLKSHGKRLAAIENILGNSGFIEDISNEQHQRLKDNKDEEYAEIESYIRKAYSHIYYPTKNGLTKTKADSDGDIIKNVENTLKNENKLIDRHTDGYAPEWFTARLWNSNADSMTTAKIREQIGKNPSVEIFLSTKPLRKTIANTVTDGLYAYWNADTNTGYRNVDGTIPPVQGNIENARNITTDINHSDIQIDDAHTVYKNIELLVKNETIDWKDETDDGGETESNTRNTKTKTKTTTNTGLQTQTTIGTGDNTQSTTESDSKSEHETTIQITKRSGENSFTNLQTELDDELKKRYGSDRKKHSVIETYDSLTLTFNSDDEDDELWTKASFMSQNINRLDNINGAVNINFNYRAMGENDSIEIEFNGDIQTFNSDLKHAIKPEIPLKEMQITIEIQPQTTDYQTFNEQMENIINDSTSMLENAKATLTTVGEI